MEYSFIRHLFFMCGNNYDEQMSNCDTYDSIKGNDLKILLKLQELYSKSDVNKKYVKKYAMQDLGIELIDDKNSD